MGAAEAERDAEALTGADDHVGAEFARRLQEQERQQVGGDDKHGPLGVRRLRKRRIVPDTAVAGGILDQHGERFVREGIVLGIADHEFDADRFATGPHHVDGLRMAVAGDEEHVALGLGPGVAERHRLGRRRTLVEQRGIGDVHPRQIGHHGLEVQQRLETALGDFRLVGCVGGVPAGILQHVTLDDRRHDGAVIAETDHRLHHPVLCRVAGQVGERLAFAAGRRQVE